MPIRKNVPRDLNAGRPHGVPAPVGIPYCTEIPPVPTASAEPEKWKDIPPLDPPKLLGNLKPEPPVQRPGLVPAPAGFPYWVQPPLRKRWR